MQSYAIRNENPRCCCNWPKHHYNGINPRGPSGNNNNKYAVQEARARVNYEMYILRKPNQPTGDSLVNKKLLAAAVGAALVAAPVLSAQAAKISVSGRVEVEVVNTDADSGNIGGTGTSSATEVADSNGMSRWGIKASEDLGNGLSAFAQIEFQINAADNFNEANRGQFVGLKGKFGKVYLGRDHSAYKTTGGVKWDPYTATFLQSRRSGGMSGTTFGQNGFRDNLLAYETPKGSPIYVKAQYVIDDSTSAGGDGAGRDGEYHIGVGWKGGPLEIIAAASHDEARSEDNAKVGARFKSGGFTGFIQYEEVDNGGPIRPNGNTIYSNVGKGSFAVVGLGYKFGNNVVAGNVGGFSADGNGNDVDYYAIGLTHFFSKKTRGYVGYASTDVKNVNKATMFGAGLRFDFG